jgi:ABC-type phosphate transport system ATPase subunit
LCLSLCLAACLSICPSARNNLPPTEWIFMKFDIWGIFRNSFRENWSYIKIWQEWRPTYMYDNILLNSLRKRNISDEVVEKLETHNLCPIILFLPKILPFMRCGKIW